MSPAGQSPTMGSSLGPLPGNGPQQSPQSGISSILPPGSGLPQTGPTPQQMIQSYMDQIKQFHSAIDALAQDHPEATQELNDAKNALTNSMAKVASAISSPDQSPQPRTF